MPISVFVPNRIKVLMSLYNYNKFTYVEPISKIMNRIRSHKNIFIPNGKTMKGIVQSVY